MKSRSKKFWLATLTLLVLGGAAFGYFIHFRPKLAVTRYKAELIARGEKLTVEEMLPLPVARAENGTPDFQRAVQLLNRKDSLLDTNRPTAMRMMAAGKAMISWQQTNLVDLSFKPPATNDWSQLAAALTAQQEALDVLHGLIERPALDFNLNYAEGFSLLLPNLASMKKAAWRLDAGASLALRDHDAAQAVKHLRALLALTKASRDERLIISQLVRMAIENIAFAATWSALQSADLTDEQLAILQRDWSELEFASSLEHALEMERAMAEMTMERMRNSSAEFQKVSTGFSSGSGGGGSSGSGGDWMEEAGLAVGRGLEAARRKAKESAWQVSWSLTDELTALKGHQVMLDTTRAARSNGCFRAAILAQRAQLAQLGITNKQDDDFNLFGHDPDLRTLFSSSLVSLGRTLDKVMAAETARQLAVTGIGLRRYFLRHGSYPQELTALMPEFLPTLPRDPVDGKPLRYRAVGQESFVLYSVGTDGVDDGGDATNPHDHGSLGWQQGRDWVWPRPASAEEIAAFYESQSKKTGSAH